MGNPRSPGGMRGTAGRVGCTAQLRTFGVLALTVGVGISLVLAASALGQSPAITPPISSSAAPQSPPQAGHELSRAQAIALVQGRYGARVVRTSVAEDKEGHRLYVFRLLSGNGKVWNVRIDAYTGAEVP